MDFRIRKFKSYIFTPQKCFIPRCKARCCTNVPLPEGFVESHRPYLQREIYSAINIGKNDFVDSYNSIIFNTTKNPIQLVGVNEKGHGILGIPPEIAKKINEEQLQMYVDNYHQYDNYCPFITDYARCSLYEQRPPICQAYGTFPGRQNYCHEKSSRFDILKYFLKEFLGFNK